MCPSQLHPAALQKNKKEKERLATAVSLQKQELQPTFLCKQSRCHKSKNNNEKKKNSNNPSATLQKQ